MIIQLIPILAQIWIVLYDSKSHTVKEGSVGTSLHTNGRVIFPNISAIIYFAAQNSDGFLFIVCTIKSWTSEAFQGLPDLAFLTICLANHPAYLKCRQTTIPNSPVPFEQVGFSYASPFLCIHCSFRQEGLFCFCPPGKYLLSLPDASEIWVPSGTILGSLNKFVFTALHFALYSIAPDIFLFQSKHLLACLFPH